MVFGDLLKRVGFLGIGWGGGGFWRLVGGRGGSEMMSVS